MGIQPPVISEFEQQLHAVKEARIELMKPSRIQRLTEQTELRMKLQTARRTAAAPKAPQSPGREVPASLQVFKSQAMRDRQLGVSTSTASLENPLAPFKPRRRDPETALPPIRRQLSPSRASEGSVPESPRSDQRPVMRQERSLRRGKTQTSKAASTLAN